MKRTAKWVRVGYGNQLQTGTSTNTTASTLGRDRADIKNLEAEILKMLGEVTQ